eukprot:Tamp_16833.p1 GENE.Tamp_16833~~Tamp_16833.p1  ORF type:complete len:399 (-),score=35.43 Tamp_16833:202-1398(-)
MAGSSADAQKSAPAGVHLRSRSEDKSHGLRERRAMHLSHPDVSLRARSEGTVPDWIEPELEAETFAILRTMIIAKTKNSVRLLSFKMFKPKDRSLSWMRRLKKEAARENLSLRQLIGHVVRGEGYTGIMRRVLPGWVGNSLSSIALFSTYTFISPYSLLVDWRPEYASAEYEHGNRAPVHFVWAGAAPYGAVAGFMHAAVAIPAKTVLGSHYAHEPPWLLLEPATPATVQPGGGCVISGGSATKAGMRAISDTVKSNPLRLASVLGSTIFAQRCYHLRYHLARDTLGFGAFFGGYEATKHLLLPALASGVSRQPWAVDKEVWVSAGTAMFAGGCAGAAYSVIKAPFSWYFDPRLSLGRKMFSREFAQHAGMTIFRQSIPNAAAFTAIELLMHYAGLHK